MRKSRWIPATLAALVLACFGLTGCDMPATQQKPCNDGTDRINFSVGSIETADGLKVTATPPQDSSAVNSLKIEVTAPSGTSIQRIVAFKTDGQVEVLMEGAVTGASRITAQTPTLWYYQYTGGAICIS